MALNVTNGADVRSFGTRHVVLPTTATASSCLPFGGTFTVIARLLAGRPHAYQRSADARQPSIGHRRWHEPGILDGRRRRGQHPPPGDRYEHRFDPGAPVATLFGADLASAISMMGAGGFELARACRSCIMSRSRTVKAPSHRAVPISSSVGRPTTRSTVALATTISIGGLGNDTLIGEVTTTFFRRRWQRYA